jgi:hypothetical protein
MNENTGLDVELSDFLVSLKNAGWETELGQDKDTDTGKYTTFHYCPDCVKKGLSDAQTKKD